MAMPGVVASATSWRWCACWGSDLIRANSTSILIAHRLSTVKTCDRIIVMREGQIIEEGDHAGLLQQGGHYAKLYNTYLRYQSLEAINTRPGANVGAVRIRTAALA